MVDWDSLIGEHALASVMPEAYGRFARPVRDGLTVFLKGLRPDQQQAILLAQAALPPGASVSQRLVTLARCCPVLHKLGQILARDQRLPAELREQLQSLESLPPSVSPDTIRRILTEELGDLEARHITLREPALAEASVAVVIAYTQPHARGREPTPEGVLKVLKPGIRERLEQELELLDDVGAHLDQRCDELGIPHLDYQESFARVRDKLRCEVQLDQEQRHLVQARAFYARQPQVHIPTLREHCTHRVTAMERIYGDKVTDHRLDEPQARRRLAQLVVEAMIARPMFSPARQAMFHSDPHAGNLLLTDSGRLGILDWSLVGSLSQAQRAALTQILVGALTLDAPRVLSMLEQLAERQTLDRPQLVVVVERWLRRIRGGEFPGLDSLTVMLDDAVQRARLRVPGELMLFRKSLLTLEGVIAELRADGFRVDEALGREFLKHFLAEWPRRWFVAPDSRDFATHLSNLDISQLLCSGPVTLARYWVGRGLDLLEASRIHTQVPL